MDEIWLKLIIKQKLGGKKVKFRGKYDIYGKFVSLQLECLENWKIKQFAIKIVKMSEENGLKQPFLLCYSRRHSCKNSVKKN